MDFLELVTRTRTTRRFDESKKISMETLRELINLARLAPFGANFQSLKYVLSNTEEMNAAIFDTLMWARHLPDWDGPEPGERPAAYIVMLQDLNLEKCIREDVGVAAQTMFLGARDKGIAGTFFGAYKRGKLIKAINMPEDKYEIMLVIALGYPGETVKIEPVPENGDIRYWRSADGVHHIPKRTLDELIITF